MENHWINNEKPPNEEWVEVKDGDDIVVAMAFYGRDGYKAHWRLKDGSCCEVNRFSVWRRIEINNEHI